MREREREREAKESPRLMAVENLRLMAAALRATCAIWIPRKEDPEGMSLETK